jgi:hypothetical protein
MDESFNRTTIEVTFDPHLFTRKLERNLDINFIEEVIRTGTIITEKSMNKKFCFKKYHGKERKTYFIVGILHQNFIEVKTAWSKKENH